MPITPLHFGILAPINHFAPRKVSNLSFILVNLWIDAPALVDWYEKIPLGVRFHAKHTLAGAIAIALAIGVLGFKSRAWVLGALLGFVAHVLLDALADMDMVPFAPTEDGTPIYLGLMEPLSLLLLPMLAWVVAQYVSGILGWLQGRWVVQVPKHTEPAPFA